VKPQHDGVTVFAGMTAYAIILSRMSFLFDKRTKHAIKWIWGGVAIFIIISMLAGLAVGIA
jgi:hypothetical protein